MELTTVHAQATEVESFSADDALPMWNSSSLHNIKYMGTLNNIWDIFLLSSCKTGFAILLQGNV